jgi:hypothetical protein
MGRHRLFMLSLVASAGRAVSHRPKPCSKNTLSVLEHGVKRAGGTDAAHTALH